MSDGYCLGAVGGSLFFGGMGYSIKSAPTRGNGWARARATGNRQLTLTVYVEIKKLSRRYKCISGQSPVFAQDAPVASKVAGVFCFWG